MGKFLWEKSVTCGKHSIYNMQCFKLSSKNFWSLLRTCLIKQKYQSIPENLLCIKQFKWQGHLCKSYQLFPSNLDSCYISKYPQNLALLSLAPPARPAYSVCCYCMLSFSLSFAKLVAHIFFNVLLTVRLSKM